MPPWLGEVFRILAWGSQSGWFGVACPAHCSFSWTLASAIFVSGFGLGSLSAICAVWFILGPSLVPRHNPQPLVPPSVALRSRVAAYVHERREHLSWYRSDYHCWSPCSCQLSWSWASPLRGFCCVWTFGLGHWIPGDVGLWIPFLQPYCLACGCYSWAGSLCCWGLPSGCPVDHSCSGLLLWLVCCHSWLPWRGSASCSACLGSWSVVKGSHWRPHC